MTKATAMADHAGKTAVVVVTNNPAMTTPNTAFTMSSSRKITIMKRARVRLPITSSESAPMDLPLFRALAQMAPKSCTPAKNIVPKVTHRTAGTQPQ